MPRTHIGWRASGAPVLARPDDRDAAATPGGPMSDRAAGFRPLFRTLSLFLVAACGEDNPLLPPPPPIGLSTILVTLNTTGTKPDSIRSYTLMRQVAAHAVDTSAPSSLVPILSLGY